ncbi:MAG: DUF1846 domain-containing protein [Defluviitaleaceae bacterium]|nr:DUF1846 domain-containing protein [Defluviitaleaceae bacterium]
MYRIGFDNEKYVNIQSEKILERVNNFDKLYLEFGGKIFEDMHGSRVLPGFEPDIKIDLLKRLADKTEIVFAINAIDIVQNRMQGDHGTNYADHLLYLITRLQANNLFVSSVAITHYSELIAIQQLKRRLHKLGIAVYTHYVIPDYPYNLNLIMSEDGFGKNDYIETTRPLVVVSAPGSGSGKMATCMSQLYHEFIRGIKTGYSKFEKFPVWNLPLNHPINLAYEAATTNIMDQNMIDPFHLEIYGESTVNYNRDIEAFPVLNAMFEKIWGKSPYRSPTDMGVNMIKECITDEDVCKNAAKQEIIRRYFKLICDEYVYGGMRQEIQKLEFLMKAADTVETDRAVVPAARSKTAQTDSPAVAIELPCGKIVTGKTTPLLSAAASALINALKVLADISDNVDLISPNMIAPIQNLHHKYLGNKNHLLQVNEVLMALSISTATNPIATMVLDQIPHLANSQAHATTLLNQEVVGTLRDLGITVTCEPEET